MIDNAAAVVVNPTDETEPGVYPNAVVTSVPVKVIAPVLVLKEVTPPWYWGIFKTPVVEL